MMRLAYKKILLILILLSTCVSLASNETSMPKTTSQHYLGTKENPIKVGVLLIEPYAYKIDGAYRGIVIDYWEKIADANDWHFEYIPSDLNYDDAAKEVAQNKFDILIGNFSTVEQRLDFVDYSRPFLINRVVVLTNKTVIDPINVFLASLTSLKAIFLLIGLIFIVASFVLWYSTRKEKKFNLKDSFYATTMMLLNGSTTFNVAKSMLITLIFLGLLFKAILIGSMTNTIFAVAGEGADPFKKKEDIVGKTFIVNEGSAYTEWVLALGGKVHYIDGLEDSAVEFYMKNLEDYDGVITENALAQFSKNKFLKKMPTLHVSKVNLRNDELVFYYNKKFPYARQVDKEIVKLQDTDVSYAICSKYFGNLAGFCV
ncbi:MAG: transporter substrate-binding domain-containing protein, partial [Pseudomonadota bacterium]|nr:transporter substrate-binding domain-containing protein [Pseudomonadota bacterium]